MTKEIYYVTSNNGKFEEVHDFLKENHADILLKQVSLDLVEIQSFDQLEVAIDKAKKAYKHIRKPVLVDDSGIFFNKYKNFPGVFTKFVYLGIGFEGLLKLVDHGEKATFLLQMVYITGPDSYEVFEGRCDGTIVVPKDFSAHSNLPYGAIFRPDGSNKTYAQLRELSEFSAFSYRLRALKKFLNWYQCDNCDVKNQETEKRKVSV